MGNNRKYKGTKSMEALFWREDIELSRVAVVWEARKKERCWGRKW